MLSERSPPEGQEDPPNTTSRGGSKKAPHTEADAPPAPPSTTTKDGGGRESPCKVGCGGVVSPLPAAHNAEAMASSSAAVTTTRRNTYTKDTTMMTSQQLQQQQQNVVDTTSAADEEDDACGGDVANTWCDEVTTTAAAMSESDETCDEAKSDNLDYDDGGAGGGDDSSDDGGGEDEDEEFSMLTTDAEDVSAAVAMTRRGLRGSDVSCSSSSSSDDDTDLEHDDDGMRHDSFFGGMCTSDEEGERGGQRSAGVGDVTSCDEGSSSSDNDTDVGGEPSPSLVTNPFHRKPIPPMEDSFLSLDEGATADEEALTEGCREKTGIMGGAKWEELMGGATCEKIGIVGGAKSEQITGSVGGAIASTNQKSLIIIDNDSNQRNANDIEIASKELLTSNNINSKCVTAVTHAVKFTCNSSLIDNKRVDISVPFTTSASTTNFTSSMTVEPPDSTHLSDAGLTTTPSITGVQHPSHLTDGEPDSKGAAPATAAYDYLNAPIPASFVPSKEEYIPNSENPAELPPASDNKYAHTAAMTRTLSLSSCGSKSGKYDTRSSAILDCRLDNESQSVVAALDDAAREAQQQLLRLNMQLQQYRKMATRKKARKLLDAKLNPALKHSLLALKIPLGLPHSALPLQVYPLKHEDVALDGCIECEAQALLERSCRDNYLARQAQASLEAAQYALTAALFRRPGERLYKVFVMREGHARGAPGAVRVVLSSHAVYVLNTCPAPSLLHALPYTQLHTLVLGAFSDWVVLLSRSAVESGGGGYHGGGNTSTTTTTTTRTPPVSGIQLCAADSEYTLEFVSCLELQTRRSLMSRAAEGSEGDLERSSSAAAAGRDDLYTAWMADGDTKVSTSQELRRSAGYHGHTSARAERHFGLSDAIEHLVPGVVEAGEWEVAVLRQWLQCLLPAEVRGRRQDTWCQLTEW